MTMRVPGASWLPPIETTDPVVDAVRADLRARSRVGIAKYGTTLAREDLSLRDWLEHALTESMDHCLYLKRAIMVIDAGGGK